MQVLLNGFVSRQRLLTGAIRAVTLLPWSDKRYVGREYGMEKEMLRRIAYELIRW